MVTTGEGTMKVLVEMSAAEVSKRYLSETNMVAINRGLMEQLQQTHPDWMVYRASDDSYHRSRDDAP